MPITNTTPALIDEDDNMVFPVLERQVDEDGDAYIEFTDVEGEVMPIWSGQWDLIKQIRSLSDEDFDELELWVDEQFECDDDGDDDDDGDGLPLSMVG